jgi:hypothetical protein
MSGCESVSDTEPPTSLTTPESAAALNSAPLPAAVRPATLYMACLGELGQFGNQLFQYAFGVAYAHRWDVRLRTPLWIGAYTLDGAAAHIRGPPLPPPSERTIVADRIVLSHAGWKRWAMRREPLATMVAAAGGIPLSGRKMRALCPQVSEPEAQRWTEGDNRQAITLTCHLSSPPVPVPAPVIVTLGERGDPRMRWRGRSLRHWA